MRRIKLVVMMIGAALSVAPIFNSAHGQQRTGGQVNILLEMEAMRQEIAELRDMIERQQFEMRKLSQQQPTIKIDKPSPQDLVSKTPNANDELSKILANDELSSNEATRESNEPAERDTIAEKAALQSAASVEERIITAVKKPMTIESEDTVPVIDRSFTQARRNLTITGNGITDQQPVNSSAITENDSVQQAQANTSLSPEAPSEGGVIAIPQNLNDSLLTSYQVRAAKNVLSATDESADTASTLSEDDYYAQGFELLKQTKYEEAVIIFERQIKAYPQGSLADDAHYWIAEAMHVSRKLNVSKQHLKIIIKDYPQSPRIPDAMLKTAYIEQSQGNKIESKMLLQEIVSFYPKSDAAIAAKNQLATSD